MMGKKAEVKSSASKAALSNSLSTKPKPWHEGDMKKKKSWF